MDCLRCSQGKGDGGTYATLILFCPSLLLNFSKLNYQEKKQQKKQQRREERELRRKEAEESEKHMRTSGFLIHVERMLCV